MGEFSVADEFRCLAAQCDVQAETDECGKNNRFFLFNLQTSLVRIATADAIELAIVIHSATSRRFDEELAQLISDCAGALRLSAAAEDMRVGAMSAEAVA